MEEYTILGNYFLVLNPVIKAREEKEKSGIILPKEYNDDLVTKEDLEKLDVVAIGLDCTKIKVGNRIKIRESRITSLDSVNKGKYLIVNESDVLLIHN